MDASSGLSGIPLCLMQEFDLHGHKFNPRRLPTRRRSIQLRCPINQTLIPLAPLAPSGHRRTVPIFIAMPSALIRVFLFRFCLIKPTCLLICVLLLALIESWQPFVYAKPDVKSKVGRTTISGYTQVQFQATNRATAESHTTFEVRRGRLQLEAELKKELSLRIEFEATTTEVKSRDLYLRYDIGRSLILKAGLLKKPFSYGRLRAARNLRIIETPYSYPRRFSRLSWKGCGFTSRMGSNQTG